METRDTEEGLRSANTGAVRNVAGIFARPAGWALCLTVLLAIAIARIVATYHVFNHTMDEPFHVACGIEWLEKGVYKYETLHPPLARISVAIGPYLAGVRGTGGSTMLAEATHILSANGQYWYNLALSRMGVLPYFILATIVAFLWTKRLFGAPAGLVAAAIFTLLPTVLAHSGVATTDVPFTALFCWALYAFTLWLKQPRTSTAAQFGMAAGLALSAKLSTLVYLPACAGAIFVTYLLAGRRSWRALLRTSSIALLCGFFVTWGVYRFSHASLAQLTPAPERMAAKLLGRSPRIAGIVHRVAAAVPIPMPELFDGIRAVNHENQVGRLAFLFGHVKRGGWWYFFFLSILFKTPITVLLLAAAGSLALVFQYLQNRSDWESAAPLASAVALMIVAAPSRFNIGIRHILPIFVFLSILAAVGLVMLWRIRDYKAILRPASIVLIGWLAISSARSHPDYLSYFNEFAGSDPSRILVAFDLDWGQDLARLSGWLHDHQVKHVSVVYGGIFDPASLGFPETEIIKCGGAALSGWVSTEMFEPLLHPACYPWIPQHPVATAGKTMRIYYLPKP